jgi:hypothetical protein
MVMARLGWPLKRAKPATRAKRAPARSAARVARRQPKVEYERLVPAPVFVISSERSGSTLLRALLDSHTQIHAPHELHLRQLTVDAPNLATRAMADLGFRTRDLENLLWDRMLHLRLTLSGKDLIVDKTPHNVHAWRRIHNYWPEARFIFLYRHPQRIYESMAKAWPHFNADELAERVTRTVALVREANDALDGLEVRYERLTSEPEPVTKEICSFLGVAWEPQMLSYGQQNDGQQQWEKGLGDWGEAILSGEIRPEKPLPARADIYPGVIEATKLTGYPV